MVTSFATSPIRPRSEPYCVRAQIGVQGKVTFAVMAFLPPKFRPLRLPVPHFRWPRPIVFQRRSHRQLARKKKRF